MLTWIGDGATKTTASHEGLNMAAVLRVPVLYVFQNNQVALGTSFRGHQVGPFTAWSKAYGIRGFSCDGNNVLDTFAATRQAVDTPGVAPDQPSSTPILSNGRARNP